MKFTNLNMQLELYVYEKLEAYGVESCKNIAKISKEENHVMKTREAYVHYTNIMHVAKLRYLHNHPNETFINHRNYTQEQFDELKHHIDTILA